MSESIEPKVELTASQLDAIWAAVPKPSEDGLHFAPHLWISWDVLSRYPGPATISREEWYKTDPMARAVMEYKAVVEAAINGEITRLIFNHG